MFYGLATPRAFFHLLALSGRLALCLTITLELLTGCLALDDLPLHIGVFGQQLDLIDTIIYLPNPVDPSKRLILG